MALIKIIIADDHKIFRQGLRLALSTDHKIKCLGEADDGGSLMDLLKDTKPDIVLLDLKMPGIDGFQTIQLIKKQYPDIKVLVLTMYDEPHFMTLMMEMGASGYLVKNVEPDEIKNAIHTIYETGVYFSELVSKALLKSVVEKNLPLPKFSEKISLTEKEVAVLKLICGEYTTTEIGEKIHLSPRTVEGVRSALLEKIGVRNTVGLVVYALKNGIVV